MSYVNEHLTNIYQMKTALLKVKDVISVQTDAVKPTRTIATISSSNWDKSTSVWTYPSILTAQSYHYYDVHLDPATSDAVNLICANADIRAKVAGSSLILECHNTSALGSTNFNLEIIDTPIKTNTIGLTYDIGDDLLVYPAITDQLRADLTALQNAVDALSTNVANKVLIAQNISIAANRWSTGSGDANYPYKATITMPGVTANYVPIVQFRDSDVLLYDFGSSATSGANSVTIYCRTAPTTTIVVPHVMCYIGTVVNAM